METIKYLTEDGRWRAVEPRAYPDGTPLLDAIPGSGINKILVRPSSFTSFMAAMFWVDALRWRGVPVRHLILPFFPGARQDRLNDTGDVLFTAKSVAEVVNARYFETVTVLDPHSDVVPALLHRCEVFPAADCINPPAGKYSAVISPDGGAEKRAWKVAKKLGVPLYHAWKSRDVTTGNISGFGLQNLGMLDGRVLVVDDICDGGGTFIGLAKELEGTGLKVHLWVTHGLFTAGTSKLLEKFEHVYCTDSVAGSREGVIEIQVCDKLMETIRK